MRLYRRHTAQCLEEISLTVKPEDLDEYKKCACPWWIGGLNDYGVLVKRHSTKCTTWKAACEAFTKANLLRSWPPEDQTPKFKPVTVKDDDTKPKTLVDAKDKWLEEIKSRTKEVTRDTYDRNVQRQLINFVADRFKVELLADLTPDHLAKMQNAWIEKGLKYNGMSSYRRHINTFLAFCVFKDWLEKNPMKKVSGIEPLEGDGAEGSDDGVATWPLDEAGDENWQLIRKSLIPFLRGELPGQKQASTLRMHGATQAPVAFGHPANPLWRNPHAFLTLVELMYETGLRRSDALHFKPENIVDTEHGGCYTTTQIKKNRRSRRSAKVTVFLEPWLVEKLRSLPRLSADGMVFYTGKGNWTIYANTNLNKPLRELGKLLSIPGSLRPHRFRDSFAVNRRNQGVSMNDLKDLLGHAHVSMTEAYYAPPVESSRAALEGRLAIARGQA